MVGVGKATLVGGGGGVESESVPDSNLLMLSNCATSNVASSSSLGVPQYWRALAILMISSIWSWYVLPRLTLFHTLVRAERRAQLTDSSLVNGMDARVLPSASAQTGELVRVAGGVDGGMFS